MKDIRDYWKAHAAAKKITREDIAALCIYRAIIKEQVPLGAKTRLHKSFRPITNVNKLANGFRPYEALESSVHTIKYSVFSKWLDTEDMAVLLDAARITRDEGLL